MNSFDLGSYDFLQYGLALVFVLALIGLVALVAKRLGVGGAVARRHGGRNRRLGVSEVLPLDGKRRLLLIRRDQAEHLVILGPNTETVVETGIAAPDENFAAAAREAARRQPPLRSSTRPAVASAPATTKPGADEGAAPSNPSGGNAA
jgi:flagellar protein FliO/FliZ